MRTGRARALGGQTSVAAALGLTLAVACGVLAAGCSDGASQSASRIAARVRVPGHPFRVAAGKRFLWVLSRGPTGACSRRRPCAVLRVDPDSNRIVGKPAALPGDAWDLTVGAGSIWVTQFDGRLIRIDARTGRISGRISARPIYFGSVVAFGDGYVWTGNDDGRYKRGSTVAKLDPASGRVIGEPRVVGSPEGPQSIAFGRGALWVADHGGWLVKIDPGTLKPLERQRLEFGPHGLVATDRAVYVADAHGNRLLEADPETAKVRRIAKLSPGPIFPVVGAHWIWSSSAAGWAGGFGTRDDRVLRIDPATLEIVETLHVGGNVPSVGFGFGSVWAADQTGRVVRITPTGAER
jgi:outer membrane protein assembly factor BamB